MKSEMEKLKDRLFNQSDGRSVENFSVFPGDNPNVTPEDIAREVNRVLDQIEAGQAEVIEDIDGDVQPIEVRDWLAERGL